MTVSGFTFCRNAVKYDYPLVESIKSALPLVRRIHRERRPVRGRDA